MGVDGVRAIFQWLVKAGQSCYAEHIMPILAGPGQDRVNYWHL